MEETELGSAAFWEGDESLVLSNPALGDSPEAVLDWLSTRRDLAGHVVFRTSGTEGEAKYVCLSKRALLVSAAGVNRHLEAGGGDRWLRALPLFHVGGFAIHARAFLEGNEVFAIEGKWDPAAFAKECVEKRITLTALVPAQVHDLVRAGLPAPDTLRVVVAGGGTLPEEQGRGARRLGWPVLQSYGLTEAGSQVATAELSSSKGGEFRNDELPLLDFWEARCDESGVLELRGEALLSAYLQVKDERFVRVDPRVDGGWVSTGDRVTLTGPEGSRRLTFERRVGDIVKILGELVSLSGLRSRLEAEAERFGLAGEIALAAVPDARRGMRLVLARTSKARAEETGRVLDGFNGAVAGYERIAETREIREIPGAKSGKIDYGRLNEIVSGS